MGGETVATLLLLAAFVILAFIFVFLVRHSHP